MKQKNSQSSIQSSFNTKKSQSYAPFGSVSPKSKKKKKVPQKQQVGPGSYDIALPIIKPLIQTIKKKNNNIIVKLAHLGTSSFQGEKDRFADQLPIQNQYVQVIGPGKYSPQKSIAYLQSSNIQKSHQFPKRKSAGIQLSKIIKNRQRKAATFSQVKKIQIQEYIQMPTAQHKQSKSKQQIQNNNKLKGSIWSKLKQQRLKQIQNPYQNVGPGKYYVDDFVKKSYFKKLRSVSEQYSAFKSQSVRSFFDNIRFQTNHQKKALIREVSGYKSSSIGPGSYDINERKSKQNKFQFFGSTVQRS